MRPSEKENFEIEMRGHYEGVGMYIGMRDGKVVVISPIEGAPAYRAGIKAGDIIVEVDGKSVEGLSLDEVARRIRGPRGTKVVLTIIREGEPKPLKFEIVRERITIPTVKTKVFENGKIGYVRLMLFNLIATAKLKEALQDLVSKGIKALIFDLRNNPGGSLAEAINIVGLFISSDTGIYVRLHNREGKIIREFWAKGAATHLVDKYENIRTYYVPEEWTVPRDIPIVVLINEGSASASEIVSGALKDYGRAILVGTKTFGKGLVQTEFSFDDDSALLVTTAYYTTAGGNYIHGKGITPDVVVELPKKLKGTIPEPEEDLQLKKAIEILKEKISP
jgi:carboxyl-terminal processing protease